MAWNPEKHPRAPEGTPIGGEFIHPGGWLAKLGDAITGRAPQRDLSRDPEVLGAAAAKLSPDDYEDRALGEIYHHQGFHAKPEMLTPQELDARVAAGWLELRRGFGKQYEYAEDFRTGEEHFPGRGIHANGTYASRNDSYMDYAQFEQGVEPEQWMTVGRMALRPDARVATLYGPEWHDWQEAQSGFVMSEYRRMGSDYDYSAEEISNRASVLHDFGRYAALRGFDAIRIPGGYRSDLGPHDPDPPGPTDHYSILNRGAVAVQPYVEPDPYDVLPNTEFSGPGLPDHMQNTKYVDFYSLATNEKLWNAVEIYDKDSETWTTPRDRQVWGETGSGLVLVRKRRS